MKIKIETEFEIDDSELPRKTSMRERYIETEKKHAIQRVQRGYDDSVAWGVDIFLNQNMPEWLEEIKKSSGYPSSLVENLNDEITPEMEEKNIKLWHKILDEIILGFQTAKKISNTDYNTREEYEELLVVFNRSMDLFKMYYFNLWS